MYTKHFNLTEMPFAMEPNPRFLVLDEDHKEALSTLVYAIDQQEGWAMLLGEPGIGKTTLVMALLRELGDRVVPAVITNPRLDALDFFNMVGLELGLEGPFSSKGRFLIALSQLIKRCHREERILLLVIDEAQSLAPRLIEELRLLGNMDDFSPRVLNIFLVGQPQLLLLLKKAGAKGLMQRLRRHYVMRPLDEEETGEYIRQRLEVAGGNGQLFNPGAVKAVHKVSGGNPRLINTLCDDSLLLCFVQGQKEIDRDMVLAAAKENPSLKWPPVIGKAKPAEKQAEPEEPDRPLADPAFMAQPMGLPGAEAPPEMDAEPEPPEQSARPFDSEVAPSSEHLLDTPEAPPAEKQPPGDKAKSVAELLAELEETDSQAPGGGPAGKPLGMVMEPAPKPGLFSRFGRSMSRETPGSFWRRLIFVLLIAAIIFGGYILWSRGGWGYLKYKVKSLLGSGQPAIFMPAEPAPQMAVENKPAPDGSRDWGPILGAPALPGDPLTQGGRGGGNG